jgi:hypothetical protein
MDCFYSFAQEAGLAGRGAIHPHEVFSRFSRQKALTGTLPEDSGLHNYRQTLSFYDSILLENPNGRSLSGGLRSAPYETLGRGV